MLNDIHRQRGFTGSQDKRSCVAHLGGDYIHKQSRSATGRAFFGFVLSAIGWAVANYIASPHITLNSSVLLWAISWNMFFAVWQVYSFFMFMYLFPKERLEMKPLYKWGLTIISALLSVVVMSPPVFYGASVVNGVVVALLHPQE